MEPPQGPGPEDAGASVLAAPGQPAPWPAQRHRGYDRTCSRGAVVVRSRKGPLGFTATHLDGLSVVHFDHVEAEAINPFSRCYKYTGGKIEMVANIY